MSALLDRSPLSPIPDTPIGLPGQPWQPFHKSIMKICRHPCVKSMLATVPMGITAGILGGPVQVVFILNLAALIPLVGLVTIAIADLSLMTGRVLEELLKASVGNAIELAIGIVAMKRGHVHMAQSTLVGSMLCYTLLVPGSCFYLAGLSKEHLHFDHTLINIMSSLLMAVCMSLLVPTIMVTFPSLDTLSPQASVTRQEIIFVSRGTAVTLLLLLGVFLLFQLKSHASIFHLAEASSECSLGRQKPNDHDGTEHQPTKIFAPQPAIVTLVAGMSCLIACVSFIVDSVNGFAQELGLSTAFLTLVLVPLVGNSTRYAAIVTVALKGHVESAVRANLNSTLRITLLVTPTLVILAWVSGLSMTLQLDTFEATMLFLAAVVMSHVIQDGKSNYFEGLMLIGTYIISVAAFYMRPGITK
ncbi:uncharacterized protein BDW43DRAFT_304064 [Aspergillus alliaceus]|uniref:uncharacterized protein n=1 Tax=Petromyces alliaceus TaxID=209559 RepID=UPI0012A654E0|nr:uncharacterized protein BDW43DRAFT_304064 [Aspergillus alliaceus]KAB8228252.1 hypothetical protein BDW43DRAFT_304064 [Aspergillus alliaceus]